MPKNLPILFAAGEEDPVGDYGKGVKKNGRDVSGGWHEKDYVQTIPRRPA